MKNKKKRKDHFEDIVDWYLSTGKYSKKKKRKVKLLDTSGKNEILQFCYGFRLYREYLC